MNARRSGFLSIVLLVLSLCSVHDLSARNGSGGEGHGDIVKASARAADTASVRAEPDSTLDFGGVYINEFATLFIKVHRVGGVPMQPPRIGSADAGMFAIDRTYNWMRDTVATDTTASDSAFIAVQFMPSRAGDIYAWAYFTSIDGTLTDSVPIHGVGLQFRVSASSVDFGDVQVTADSAGCVIREVTIENLLKGDGEFYIELPDSIIVSGRPGAISVFYQPDAMQRVVTGQGVITILFRFCPRDTGADSAYWRGIVKSMRDQEGIVVGISVTGNGINHGIRLSRAILDFGCGPVGKADTLSLDIINDSTAEVVNGTIWSRPDTNLVKLENPEILRSPLLPGSIWRLKVVFTREAETVMQDDTIIINTSAGLFSVLIRGRAIATSYKVDQRLAFDSVRTCGSQEKLITIDYKGCPATLHNIETRLPFLPIGVDSALSGGGLYQLRVLFSPDSAVSYIDSIRFMIGDVGFSVQLSGRGFIPSLASDRTAIRFDSAATGEWVHDTITLVNTSSEILVMTEKRLETPDRAFEILDDPTYPYKGSGMLPDDTVRYIVRFAPTDSDSTANAVLIGFECGPNLRIPINGTGRRVVVDELHDIVVDSDSSHVGERFTVKIHIEPAITSGEGVTGVVADLYVNPKSFYVHGATAGGVDLKVGHDTTTGVLTVTRGPEVRSISDTLLFTLELEGLVSGQPLDTIVVNDVDLIGGPNARRMVDPIEFEPGIIILTGCDVGRGIGFSKSTAMRTLKPNPARGTATAEYIAARGSFPFIEIYDLTGRPVSRIDLPEGTGEEQSAEIAMTGIPAGAYLLQLRMESERSTILMIVGE